jgi:hypothetical protein
MSSVFCPPVKGGSEPKASRGFGFLFCRLIREQFLNPRANALKLLKYFGIGEPDHPDTLKAERFRSSFIVPFTARAEMRVPIQLNHHSMSRAVKVRDIVAERFLPAELLEMAGEKIEPQLALCRRGVTAQIARTSLKIPSVTEKRANRPHGQ